MGTNHDRRQEPTTDEREEGSTMKRLLAIAATLALVLTACGLAEDAGTTTTAGETTTTTAGDTTGTTAEDTTTTAPLEPIKMGATLPLTGPFADTGVFVRDGYEAMVEHINDEGGLLGRPIELSIEDDASDPGQAASLLEKLITVDQVEIVLGGYPGSSAAAQMATAEQHGKVYVSMGGHMASFEQGFAYSFGAPPLMGQWWYRGFFDYISTLPEAERPTAAAMITVNNPVGAAVREGTVADLAAAGIEVVMDELYDLPLASAEPLVSQARASGADLFIANSFFPDGVQVIRAVHALEYQPKAILEGIGTLIPSWKEELGDEGDYVFSGTAMHPDLPFSEVDLLRNISEERYGTDAPPIYFMFGATWADTLVQAVEGAGSTDQQAIGEWLRSNEVCSFGGCLTFDDQGLPEPYSYLVQVQNGVPELVWPEDIATTAPIYPIPWDE
jgi:branched-chain amino acid transport system substrate-binding protein